MSDLIDEIIGELTRAEREKGRDPAFLTRKFVNKLLSELHKTAEQFLQDRRASIAGFEPLKQLTPEEIERLEKIHPALIMRLYSPMDLDGFNSWVDCGLMGLLKDKANQDNYLEFLKQKLEKGILYESD